MKCVNIRTTEGTVLFDCPHCGLEAVIEDASMLEVWADYQGMVTCPIPTGCNQQYEIPTTEEVEASRAAGAAPAGLEPASEPAAATEAAETDGADPATESPGESDASEAGEGEEPEKPKFSGPFRYVSKSDEDAASGLEDEFEKHLAAKDEKEETVDSPLLIRTFRRLDCIVRGKNKFDDMVSEFLGEVGRENVISVTPITYTEKSENVTDYGVIIYYAQPQAVGAQPANAAEEKKSEPVAWRD